MFTMDKGSILVPLLFVFIVTTVAFTGGDCSRARLNEPSNDKSIRKLKKVGKFITTLIQSLGPRKPSQFHKQVTKLFGKPFDLVWQYSSNPTTAQTQQKLRWPLAQVSGK